jgi:hypothetical protein
MRKVLMALLVTVSLACDSDVTGSSTVNGPYTLRTVNGSPLPYITSGSGTTKSEIVDDVITLYEGGTYAELGHSRITVNGQVTTETTTEGGTYSLFGNSVILRSGNGIHVRMPTIEANTMTLVENGMRSVFRK